MSDKKTEDLPLPITTYDLQYNQTYLHSLGLKIVSRQILSLIFQFITEAASDTVYNGRASQRTWKWEPVLPALSSLFLELKRITIL